MKIPYINTNDGVTIVLGNRPRTISSEDPNYDRVIALIESDTEESEYEALLTAAARKLQQILMLAPGMEYSDGAITYRGEILANYTADRLVQHIQNGRDWRPLANFLDKVMQNPSKRAVDHLYAFLEAGNIPLTPDGDFLVYKAVREDYRDIHSGRFNNTVGSIVSMPRNAVDENPDRTCSAGLHVCSFDYLPYFAHAHGHVMVCKVNPADVVAIPADYNNTKMRVSRYEVVNEVDGYYQEHRDVLGEAGADRGIVEPEFTVVADNGVFQDEIGEYFSFEEAKRQARRHQSGTGDETAVLDADGFVVFTVNGLGDEY